MGSGRNISGLNWIEDWIELFFQDWTGVFWSSSRFNRALLSLLSLFCFCLPITLAFAFDVLWCFMLFVFLFSWEKWKALSWIFWCEMGHHWLRQRQKKLFEECLLKCLLKREDTFIFDFREGLCTCPVSIMDGGSDRQLLFKPMNKIHSQNGARQFLKWGLRHRRAESGSIVVRAVVVFFERVLQNMITLVMCFWVHNRFR